jgi:hypothetical protein
VKRTKRMERHTKMSAEFWNVSYIYVSWVFICLGNDNVRTVTRERCFIDTPPSDALAVRAMLPQYPCSCMAMYECAKGGMLRD